MREPRLADAIGAGLLACCSPASDICSGRLSVIKGCRADKASERRRWRKRSLACLKLLEISEVAFDLCEEDIEPCEDSIGMVIVELMVEYWLSKMLSSREEVKAKAGCRSGTKGRGGAIYTCNLIR